MHRGFIIAIMSHGLHQAKLGAVAASRHRAIASAASSSTIYSTISGIAFGTVSRSSSRTTKPRQVSSRQNIGGNRVKQPLGFALTLDSDSGVLGDYKTSSANVDLVGLTVPKAKVTLAGFQTTADANGRFLFTNHTCLSCTYAAT